MSPKSSDWFWLGERRLVQGVRVRDCLWCGLGHPWLPLHHVGEGFKPDAATPYKQWAVCPLANGPIAFIRPESYWQ